MRRAQRRLHRLLWLVMAPLLFGLLIWAIASRQSIPARTLPAGIEEGR